MTPFRPRFLPALAAAYAATFALACLTQPPDRLWLAALIALPLIWISHIDLARQEIPDLATAIIALSGAVFQWHLHGLTLPLLVTLGTAAFLTAVLWWAGGWYFRRRGDEALGIGDAKLIGAGTLCLGAGQVWAMVFVAATGGIVAALLARRRGRTQEDNAQRSLAFGPFLAYAIFIFVNFPLPGPAAP
jgi:leader peptidase (prepilin peptidase)/N-methyltransferase